MSEEFRCRLEVVQQCRESDIEMLKKQYISASIDHKIDFFISNIAEVLINSHLVISRAGASSLSEILVANIPSILIPFKYSKDNHQFINARKLTNSGASWLIEEDSFTEERLFSLLNKIFFSIDVLSRKSKATLNIAKPDAAKDFVSVLDQYFFDNNFRKVNL